MYSTIGTSVGFGYPHSSADLREQPLYVPLVSRSAFEAVTWRELVAVGIVANDMSATTIARCAGVSLVTAQAAIAAAREEGVLSGDAIDPAEAVRLVGELPAAMVVEVHTVVARYLLSEGPARLLEAIAHARSAGTLSPTTELVSIADQAAGTSLSVGDYASAQQFLEFAHEFGTSDPPILRAQRLCRLAAALDGLGLVTSARRHLTMAFEVARFEGDAELAVTAAVDYVLPVDWYAGDQRATAQLQRAEALACTEDQRVRLLAARAMAEMRIPVPTVEGQQMAWVTRPSVAQPLAEVALERSDECSEHTRLLALLAWRTTHRAPAFLERRRRLSAEAFDMAQRLRQPGRQVDAAVMLAVDALESADRPGSDRALTVLRWIAEADGNPRLAWHAHAVASGAAHLDGDLDAAERHRHAAREFGRSIETPGWPGADLLLLGQELVGRADHDQIVRHLPYDSGAALLHPLGKLIVGVGHAVVGDYRQAEHLLRIAMRQFDPEASLLLCLTRAVDLVIHLDAAADDIAEQLWVALEPWSHHVAVDSQAWFCDGPVSGWLALLAHHRGDQVAAWRYLRQAEPVARSLGDVRTLDRLAALWRSLDIGDLGRDLGGRDLDERERAILQLVVEGWSNQQIADSMAFSRSTIRNDLTGIYRKLGVSTRIEAASCALRLGICVPPTTGAPDMAVVESAESFTDAIPEA